jgi:hypothetical protein
MTRATSATFKLRDVSRFVVIVWSVAASFQLLTMGTPWVLARFYDSAIGPWTIPRVPSQCKPAPPSGSSPAAAESRRLTWQLGLATGHAVARSHLGHAGAEELGALERARAGLAQALAVRTPIVPALKSPSGAFHEFDAYLMGDPECVAHDLERGHSPTLAASYRFATVVGYALFVRSSQPRAGPVFAPELRQFGSEADVPRELWLPLTEEYAERSEALPALQTALTKLGQHFGVAP